jgi:hypothetical protein
MARERDCPAAFARYLTTARTLAPSLLSASRLVKKPAVVITGADFTLTLTNEREHRRKY